MRKARKIGTTRKPHTAVTPDPIVGDTTCPFCGATIPLYEGSRGRYSIQTGCPKNPLTDIARGFVR